MDRYGTSTVLLAAALLAFAAPVPVRAQSIEQRFAQAVIDGDVATASALLRRRSVLVHRRIHATESLPLNVAAGACNETMVKLLLRYGADTDAEDAADRTPLEAAALCDSPEIVRLLAPHLPPVRRATLLAEALCLASQYGSMPTVRALLAAGADPNVPLRAEMSVLFCAAYAQRRDVLDTLIAHGGNAFAVDGLGNTLLHAAASVEPAGYDSSFIAHLLELHLDVNGVDRSGFTPLHEAAARGSERLVLQLLQAGARIDAVDEDDETPVQEALDFHQPATMRLLIAHGAKLDGIPTHEGWMPLFEAAQEGDTVMMEVLLDGGADPCARTTTGTTPLMSATYSKSPTAVRMLLAHGADASAFRCDGSTALHSLARDTRGRNDTLIARLLAEYGAPVERRDNEGFSALGAAVIWENVALVQWLLNNGATVDHMSTYGADELHHAVINGNVTIVRLLCDHGAIVSAGTSRGHTPLHLAALNGYDDLVAELLVRGAPVDAVDTSGATPLHLALNKSNDVLERLIRAGADVNARDHAGRTPIAVAEELMKAVRPEDRVRFAEAIELLRAHGGTK